MNINNKERDMSNIINRINNEFDFNYQKFIKNNTVTEATSIKSADDSIDKYNNSINNKPKQIDVEEMDFDAENKSEEKVEVLELDE